MRPYTSLEGIVCDQLTVGLPRFPQSLVGNNSSLSYSRWWEPTIDAGNVDETEDEMNP